MELPFVTLDVFTTTRYRGNPLAVVIIPASAPKPSQAQKQAIAREFNLSETVFVHDVADPQADTSRDIDIFLTTAEIPFAGHPTIGAAVHLFAQGTGTSTGTGAGAGASVNQVVTKAGPILLARTGPDSAAASIPHSVRLHKNRLADLVSAGGLAARDLQPDDEIRRRELAAPIFSIIRGVTFALIELPSLELLAQVQLSRADIPGDELLDEGWRQGFIGRLYYVRTSSSSTGGADSPSSPVRRFRTRMIAHGFEDPATGSASCCLASFISVEGDDKRTTPSRRYEFTQGVEMGKESNIGVEVVNKPDGSGTIDKVILDGSAVQVMRGYVTI